MASHIQVGTCGLPISLAKYVQIFEALELNSTFYRFPGPRALKNWQKILGTKERLFLSLKAYQGLTHPLSSPTWRRSGLKGEELKKLKGKVGCLKFSSETEGFVSKSLDIIKCLGARFWLFQLPKRCQREQGLIPNFFEKLKGVVSEEILLGIEIRWENPLLIERLYRDFGVIPVFDPFLSPELFEKFAPSLPLLYLRLHGSLEKGRINYIKSYSDEELETLRERLQSTGAQRIIVLFNNTKMYEDALRFKQLLSL
ncbi:DUF72 domain-containing protein [Thermosulfuriphilus sp.]